MITYTNEEKEYIYNMCLSLKWERWNDKLAAIKASLYEKTWKKIECKDWESFRTLCKRIQNDESLFKENMEAIESGVVWKYKDKWKQTYDSIVENEWKKAMKVLSSSDNFLEHLREYIKDYKPRETKRVDKSTLRPYSEWTIDVWFSDIHIGKVDTEWVKRRMRALTEYVINRSEKTVNMICLWDLVEAIVEGGMHPGQIEGMAWVFGFDLLMDVVNTFEEMLINIYNSGKNVTFYGMWGNHDRFGKTHGDDKNRTAALVAYELIKRWLSNYPIDIKILRDKTSEIDTSNFHYILNHWDEGFDARSLESTLWKYGDWKSHNVIMYGDKHNVNIRETRNATCIGLPAIAWKNEYDTRNGYFSESGFVVVTKNTNGLPDIFLKRIL